MTFLLRSALNFFGGKSPREETYSRHSDKYKNCGRDSNEMRQRRVDNCNKNRCEKRNEQTCKNRNIEVNNCGDDEQNDEEVEECQDDNEDENESDADDGENAMCDVDEADQDEDHSLVMDDILNLVCSEYIDDRIKGVEGFTRKIYCCGKEAIDAGFECNIVTRLVEFITDAEDEDLVRISTATLRMISLGTRSHVTDLVKMDCIRELICLLTSKDEATAEHAVWTLGGIAAETTMKNRARIFIGITRMPIFVKKTRCKSESLLQAIAWAMTKVQTCWSATCRKNFLPLIIKFLIYEADDNFLNYACELLSFGTLDDCDGDGDDILDEDNVVQLAQTLLCGEIGPLLLSLYVIHKIISDSDQYTECLRNENILQTLGNHLRNPFPWIQRKSATCMELITGNMMGYSADIVDFDILPIFIDKLSRSDDVVGMTVANIMCNVVCDIDADCLRVIIEGNFLPSLSITLQNCNYPEQISAMLICFMCILEAAKLFNLLENAATVIHQCGGMDAIKSLGVHQPKNISAAARKLDQCYFHHVSFNELN